eukprot:COSAG02_NODE_5710_length_4103_cov_12.837662_2_plen_731_part_00
MHAQDDEMSVGHHQRVDDGLGETSVDGSLPRLRYIEEQTAEGALPTGCSRCGSGCGCEKLHRFCRRRHWGFTTLDLLSLVSAVIMPTLDSARDWWITFSYLEGKHSSLKTNRTNYECEGQGGLVALTGEDFLPTSDSRAAVSRCVWDYSWSGAVGWGEFYGFSLAIMLASGAASGVALARWYLIAKLRMPKRRAYFLGLALGLPGLAILPVVVMATRARDVGDATNTMDLIQRLRAIELMWELLPQANVQTTFMFAIGAFDGGADRLCDNYYYSYYQKAMEPLRKACTGQEQDYEADFWNCPDYVLAQRHNIVNVPMERLCEEATIELGYFGIGAETKSRCAYDYPEGWDHYSPRERWDYRQSGSINDCRAVNHSRFTSNSWKLASLVSLFLSAGMSMFGTEAHDRKGLGMATMSRYGIIKILANGAQIASMTFLGSQIAGDFDIGGLEFLWAIPMIVAFFVYSLLKLGRGSGWLLRRLGCVADIRHREQGMLVLFIAIVGTLIAVVEGKQNENGELVRHFSLVLVSVAVVLTPLSWLVDPEFGSYRWRAFTYEEQLARDSEGMTAAELLEAKAKALWRWADVFQDGLLEKDEVDRLAEETVAARSSHASHSGDAGGLDTSSFDRLYDALQQARTLNEQQFVRLCGSNPQDTAEWFAALRLPLVPPKGCVAHIRRTCCCGDVELTDLGKAEQRLANTVGIVMQLQCNTRSATKVPQKNAPAKDALVDPRP